MPAKVLKKYEKLINSLKKDYIQISPRKINKIGLKPWESKFGGNPYLPKNKKYPVNKKGKYLRLLAQINFDEVPKFHPFPDTGLLQFWIYPDTYHGKNFDDMVVQDNFRIIYYPKISKEGLITDFSFLRDLSLDSEDDLYSLPVSKECSLKFSIKKMHISDKDFHFDKEINEKIDKDDLENFEREYFRSIKKFRNLDHKLGGYANFAQGDPRAEEKKLQNFDTMLLQIESDFKADIMWGDNGVGNFFISEKNLLKKNFSKVLYTWDCG